MMMKTAGDNIGPYQITRQIGSGGMATVYQAYQQRLDRHVAIKVMHQSFAQDANFLKRFEREARIVARLDHPSIVPIYDYDEVNNQPYLVMKFIDGVTLKDILRKRVPEPEAILQIMRPIANALTYAHTQGVLHRDIKPSNIMIDQEGRAYLTDFGLARLSAQGESTMSADTMLGTPHYISPEQAQGATDLDARTDVYSLGVVLYELVTGRVPFMADTSIAIVHNHIYTAPPPPSEINPNVSAQVEAVVLRALEKTPARRYETPNALIDAYAQAVAGRSTTPAASDRQNRQTAPPEPPQRPIPSPVENQPAHDDRPRSGFDEIKRDLQEAGQDIKAAFEEIATSWGGTKPGRLIPRSGADWVEDGPEGRGFYTKEELATYEDMLPEDLRIRRRVENKIKQRNEFRQHLGVFIAVNIMLWVIWAVSGAGFPWPIFPMMGWGIGLVAHFIEYYQNHGAGRERAREFIEQEIARERARLSSVGPAEKAKNRGVGKAKNDRLGLDDLPGVRLTGDGELSESFIDEIDDQQRRN